MGAKNIWSVPLDGRAAKPLTKNAVSGTGGDSEWVSPFPDVSKVLFTSQSDFSGGLSGANTQTFNLWTLNADGSGPTQLTLNSGSSAYDAFPDGIAASAITGCAP